MNYKKVVYFFILAAFLFIVFFLFMSASMFDVLLTTDNAKALRENMFAAQHLCEEYQKMPTSELEKEIKTRCDETPACVAYSGDMTRYLREDEILRLRKDKYNMMSVCGNDVYSDYDRYAACEQKLTENISFIDNVTNLCQNAKKAFPVILSH